ncbi:MAG: Uma2 family endonuclease [Actinopolymorphaceae bacterium]
MYGEGSPVTQPAFAVDSWPDFWTEDDLAALPDDGHRYEIIDGSLIVNPPSTSRHQSVVANLLAVLREAAPPGWRILHEVGIRVPGGNAIRRRCASPWHRLGRGVAGGGSDWTRD